MSEHLPECSLTPRYTAYVDEDCICDRLRACEARLEDDWLNRYNAAEQRGYDAGFRNGQILRIDTVEYGQHLYNVGYAKALDRALDAVVGLRTTAYESASPWQRAIAAIDALKEGP